MILAYLRLYLRVSVVYTEAVDEIHRTLDVLGALGNKESVIREAVAAPVHRELLAAYGG